MRIRERLRVNPLRQWFHKGCSGWVTIERENEGGHYFVKRPLRVLHPVIEIVRAGIAGAVIAGVLKKVPGSAPKAA